VAGPCGSEDADGQQVDDEESDHEDGPNKAGNRLHHLGIKEAGNGGGVENDHHNGDGVGNEAQRHGRKASRLKRIALEERHRVLDVVGHGDAVEGARNHGDATLVLVSSDRATEVPLEVAQGVRAANAGPAAAGLVVVKANAVGRAEELISAVVDAHAQAVGGAVIRAVGNDRKVLCILKLNDGHSVGEDGGDGHSDYA
jgi:hypothetical protein